MSRGRRRSGLAAAGLVLALTAACRRRFDGRYPRWRFLLCESAAA